MGIQGKAAVVEWGDGLMTDTWEVVATGRTPDPTTATFQNSEVVALPQFDSLLGTLTSVTIEVTTDPSTGIGYEGFGGRWEKVDGYSLVHELSFSGTVGSLSVSSPGVSQGYSSTGPFGGAPGATGVAGAQLTYSVRFELGSHDLSGFIGDGTFNLEFLQGLSVSIDKGNGFSSSPIHEAGLRFQSSVGGTVGVTYGYVPGGPVVPEPEEWAIYSGALLMLWMAARRRGGAQPGGSVLDCKS